MLAMVSLLVAARAAAAAAPKNVTCTGGGSLACTGTAAACCNIGTYAPDLQCYDPADHACCHYEGGPGGPPRGSLCTTEGHKCCVQVCYAADHEQCCHDQYGSGHTCNVTETCQTFGCGPAAPASGSFCINGNTTQIGVRVVIDDETSTLNLWADTSVSAHINCKIPTTTGFPGMFLRDCVRGCSVAPPRLLPARTSPTPVSLRHDFISRGDL